MRIVSKILKTEDSQKSRITLRFDSDLEKLSDKVLFPKKLGKTNKFFKETKQKSEDLVSILKSKKKVVDIELDYVKVKSASMILRAVNHKLRQQIIKLLDCNDLMTVTEIYVKLRLEQSVASQHLAILRRANLIISEREGKFIHYRVNYKKFDAITEYLNSFMHSGDV